MLAAFPAHAAAPDDSASGGEPSKASQPEEEDFSTSPFTEYGEFNEDKDEEEDARYFQHGRFFGVSLGLGFEGVTGNRGLLWQGGFPLVDFKVHYWFDFHFAIDLGLFFASHYYEASSANGGHVDVNMIRVGVDGKYYFDTKDLSAPISFANPYLILGVGTFTKSENSFTQGVQNAADTGVGLSMGAGLEFAIVPKKSYLEFEAKYHLTRFKDTNTTQFQATENIQDLTGGFYTLQANLLFTW